MLRGVDGELLIMAVLLPSEMFMPSTAKEWMFDVDHSCLMDS